VPDLKEQLRADLTTAMKARDELRTATLRTEQAERELAEGEVLAGYLPAQLEDADLAAIVADVITRTGASGMKDMGKVMGAANGVVAGRADGGRVAAEVRRQLA
jgi:uncharacterized protein YqeY